MTEHPDVVTPVTAALVRGALELEPTEIGVRPHRLPAWARTREADAQLSLVESQPAGVRLVAATTASWIELKARAGRPWAILLLELVRGRRVSRQLFPVTEPVLTRGLPAGL